MKKKIASILMFATILSMLPIYKTHEVKAATKTHIVEYEYTGVKPWVANPTWEPISNNYGTHPSTYAYDDGTYKGTLKATRMKAEPIGKTEVWVKNRKSSTISVSSVTKVSRSAGEPAFSDTYSVTFYDDVLKKDKTGTIPKSGSPKSSPVAELSKYTSWGRANNYDKVFNTFYGVLSDNPTTYAGGYKFSDAPNQDYLYPSRKFYGDLTVLDSVDVDATVDIETEYINPGTGKEATGMAWAEPVITATDFAKLAYRMTSIGNGSEQTNNRNNMDKKPSDLLFTSGGYHFRSEPTTVYTTKKDLDMRSSPTSTYDKKMTIPKGTKLERTISSGLYIMVFYNGKGGWIRESDTTTSDVGGQNYRDYRRGITLLYKLTKTYDVYTQNYSGTIALDDYISGYTAPKWKVSVEYTGDVADYTENDIKVNSVSVSPTSTEIPYGDSSNSNNLTFTYEVEQTHVGTYANATISPKVEIFQGTSTTPIYTGSITLNKASKKAFTTTVNGANIKSGDNTFKVHVNRDKALTERSLTVTDIYLNNTKEVIHKGVAPSKINLSVESITAEPQYAQIAPGEIKTNQSMKFKFRLESDVSVVGTTSFSSKTEIIVGGVIVWTGNVIIPQGGYKDMAITVPNVTIGRGNNTITVRTNNDKGIVEKGITNPYSDNSISLIYKGQNANMNNLRVSNLKITPTVTLIDEGKSNKPQDLTFMFDLEHQISATPGAAIFSPLVKINFGGLELYSKPISIKQGTKERHVITIPDVLVPLGNIPVTITANISEVIDEYDSAVSNPYADNIIQGTYAGIRYLQCDLPDTVRKVNTWNEKWTKTTYNGSIMGSLCYLTSVTVTEKTVSYMEKYEITEIYFRSKWTKDMHSKGLPGYNAIPWNGPGWTLVKDDSILRVKGGYAFELRAVTQYETNRNKIEYTPSLPGAAYSGAGGSGVNGYSWVTPSITPIYTPTILYVNYGLSGSTKVCKLMRRDSWGGAWDHKNDFYSIKSYTNFGAKSGIYDVTISTPRTDKPNAFRGYEPETPVGAHNKNFLHDSRTFQIEVLGQDDLKTHIVN